MTLVYMQTSPATVQTYGLAAGQTVGYELVADVLDSDGNVIHAN